MERQPPRSSTTYHENGRTRRAEVFQADHWPKRRHNSRRRWNKLKREWAAATPFLRIMRVWWWCVCALLGAGLALWAMWMAILLWAYFFG